MKQVTAITSLLIAYLVLAPASPADLLSQTDTFNTGVMNWGGGTQAGGSGPVHVSTGGPDGSGFVNISHTGFHVGTKNSSQWSGDFIAGGVAAIKMDLKHLSGDALNVRLVLFGAGGLWATSGLQPVAESWTKHTFGVTASDMVHVNGGTANLNDTLGGVTTLLIRHDTLIPTVQGGHPPHVTAAMGIDNIEAIPEPGTLAYLMLGGIGAFLARQYRMGSGKVVTGNCSIDNFR